MKKIFILFSFINLIFNTEFVIKRFIGLNDKYPNSEEDDSYVKTVPNDDPYISISE